MYADFAPFGGYKQSGVGRELGGPGLQEYTQIKRIHVPQFADHRTNATFAIMSDDKRTHGFIYNCPTAVAAGHGALSSIGKAVCVALTNGGKTNDHVSMHSLTGPQTPHICIPTTAGTGSDVTNVAVLTSRAVGRKMFLVDQHIIPNAAILDPRFTVTLPPGIAATTAMDAMTHAIEALTSTMSNPVCDAQALHAVSDSANLFNVRPVDNSRDILELFRRAYWCRSSCRSRSQ